MTDNELIEGVWALVSGERGGSPLPGELVETITLTFSGGRLTTTVGGRTTSFPYRLAPDEVPAAIDLELDGDVGRGIYQLDGDRLMIVHGEVGAGRPTEFRTSAGSSLTLMRLARKSGKPDLAAAEGPA